MKIDRKGSNKKAALSRCIWALAFGLFLAACMIRESVAESEEEGISDRNAVIANLISQSSIFQTVKKISRFSVEERNDWVVNMIGSTAQVVTAEFGKKLRGIEGTVCRL